MTKFKEKGPKVLIVGGGFGGVSTTLSLVKEEIPNAQITLISDKSHFEYKPALYKVVTGGSTLEVCIPVSEILIDSDVKFVIDSIVGVDKQERMAKGASGQNYEFDFLVLAFGSETAFFNIPGLEEFSFGFKTIYEATKLKRHIHELFSACKDEGSDRKVCLLQVVIVGAGPSGVELAGELAVFMKQLAKEHNTDQSLITIDLVEAASRVLPSLPKKISEKVSNRLRHLGVNIFANRAMTEEKVREISVRGLTMKTETVVWTAGVKPNGAYKEVEGFNFDQKGRVLVDDFLRAKGFNNIFVIGDGASTPKSGMAQTAIYDGKTVSENIARLASGRALKRRSVKKTYHVLPVGPGWAATMLGPITLYGFLGWTLRRMVDFRYFLSILPLRKAIVVYRRGRNLCDTCDICEIDA